MPRSSRLRKAVRTGALMGACALAGGALFNVSAQSQTEKNAQPPNATQTGKDLVSQGRQIFRFDDFGDNAFWSGALQLDKAIAGRRLGGVGPGVSPKTALSVGLKVDAHALPDSVLSALKAGKVNLNSPATTVALIKLNAVVGVKPHLSKSGRLTSVGLTCAVCHSTVNNSVAPGIGGRLDGWPNRDLKVGGIVSPAPNLKPVTDLLGVDAATVKKVLAAWGPGKFDAKLFLHGQGFPPRGPNNPHPTAARPPLRRQDRRDADPAGLRPGRREPPHVHRLGLDPVLERLRGGPRDARTGRLHGRPARQRGEVPGRRAQPDGPHASARRARPGPRQAARAPGLPALAGRAASRQGHVRPRGRPPRQGALRRQGDVRVVPHAADVLGPGAQPALAGRDLHRRLPGAALADGRLPHDAARRSRDPDEGRLLPRRALPDARPGGAALRQLLQARPQRARAVRPGRVPEEP